MPTSASSVTATSNHSPPSPRNSRWRRYAPYLIAAAAQLVLIGYIKDDAFIEYRFATHLAEGHGMVFNVGDPAVEGATSFLWTLFLALPAWLGLNLAAVAKVIGATAVLAVVFLVGEMVSRRGGDGAAIKRARYIAATSGTLLVWGQSGMEPAIAAAVVMAGALSLTRPNRLSIALSMFAIAAAIRPELHIVFGLAVVLALGRMARDPSTRADAALGILLGGAILTAVHATRFHWYGGLVPNTALVKTATLSLRAGMKSLAELAVTGFAGLLIVLALDEARRRRDDVALLAASSLLLFIVYIVRVGRDEMILCRLYLPVLPLAIVFASLRLSEISPRRARLATLLVCACGAGFGIGYSYVTLYWHFGTRSYVPLAETMRARSRSGDLAIFQDLGRTPFNAMELRFVDPIGLVDREVATLLHDDHANPFLRIASEGTQRRIRDHLFALHPRFIAWVAYVGWSQQDEVARRFAEGERESLMRPFLGFNSFYVGLDRDPRFLNDFRFVDAWHRHDGYYLVLFERRE